MNKESQIFDRSIFQFWESPENRVAHRWISKQICIIPFLINLYALFSL